MAAPRKRVLRKEIRQPDQFMVWTGRVLDWVKTYQRQLVGGVVGIAVVVGAVLGWQYYRGYRQDQAVRAYSAALVEYQEGRYEAALEAFRDLRAKGEAPYDQLADLYIANSYIAMNQPANAVEVLSDVVGAERDGFVSQVMLVTLGLAHEMNGSCEDALTTLSRALDQPGPLRQEAMLGQARCSARIGNTQDAAETYKAYLKEFPEAGTVEIALRLQQLEGKSGKSAATTKASQ